MAPNILHFTHCVVDFMTELESKEQIDTVISVSRNKLIFMESWLVMSTKKKSYENQSTGDNK